MGLMLTGSTALSYFKLVNVEGGLDTIRQSVARQAKEITLLLQVLMRQKLIGIEYARTRDPDRGLMNRILTYEREAVVASFNSVALTEKTKRLINEISETEIVLSRITEAVTAITDHMREIAQAIEGKSGGSDALEQSIEAISDGARSASNSAMDANRSSKELNDMAVQMQTVVSQLLPRQSSAV